MLNDLILRRKKLFANPRTAYYATMVLFALVLTGALGKGLDYAVDGVLNGVGSVVGAVFRSMGLMG